MQYTSNFNFMIAEGTDTVNLLTQCYPNFTSLDSILQAIKEHGVTPAISTKTGTVHAIVRTDADCDVIRWVNTANYAAGDTFTVDGVAVTATAMDGTSLPAGAFVINQSSMAILNGTVLTFVGIKGSSTAAGTTYDNTGSGLTATNVQDAIDEVLSDIPANAAALAYDNTGSGLVATDVQDAIDELAGAISTAHYVAKASATPNTTFASQLAELQTAYAALTADEKRRSIISSGDAVFSIVDTSTGLFTWTALGGSNVDVMTLEIVIAKCKEFNGNTVVDRSSQTTAATHTLYVLE